MRDKLVELIVTYCMYNVEGENRPCQAHDLEKHSDEYLMELLEKFLTVCCAGYRCWDNYIVEGTKPFGLLAMPPIDEKPF